jgi:hypothetical protein
VAQIQAVADRIREELKYTSIRSPLRGIVLSRAVEIGSAVSSILSMGAGATTVMVLGDALQWARKADSDVLLVETPACRLRCSAPPPPSCCWTRKPHRCSPGRCPSALACREEPTSSRGPCNQKSTKAI